MSRPERHGRAAYRHFITVTTRWADNDSYGHVNNTVYYQWFDSAVNAVLIEARLLDIYHGDPIGLVAETGCSYYAPLSFPGDIEVGIAVERLGNTSVTYRLGIFAKGSDQPAAQGHFTHVTVDRASRRPVPLPDQWRETLSRLV